MKITATDGGVMVIKTKYRDISDKEVKAAHPTSMGFSQDVIEWETERRGREVSIITPALPDRDACGGPFYRVAGRPDSWVCPHIAEIGD